MRLHFFVNFANKSLKCKQQVTFKDMESEAPRPTKVCVFGAKGWIGTQIVPLFEQLGWEVDIPPENIRADDELAVRAYIGITEPDRVVCVLGRTHGPGCGTIDYIEDKLPLNIRDNLFAPLTLALACKERNIHFSYLGTGCIFEYDEHNGKTTFTEEDMPNFQGSGYSIVKGFTDRIMRQLPKDVLQVRIRMPITGQVHPRNFITKIVNYDKVCSMENSMTVLPDLLPCFVDMIKKALTGTVNLTNPGTISHNTILGLYKDIVDPTFTWKNFTVEEQNEILKSKRSNNQLDTSLLQLIFPEVPNINEAVKRCLQTMAAGIRRASIDSQI